MEMFTLPELPYEYNALEPYIDEETMHLHHDKHHATYVKNLNDALSGHNDLLTIEVEELIQHLDNVPEDVRTKVRNNGGGHANHSMFWQIMRPAPGSSDDVEGSESAEEPSGEVFEAINSTYGDFASFQEKFAAAGANRFGSGWVWLVVKDGKLEILDTPNQDSPLMDGKGTPILCLDVWEHAYYLKYQNVRAYYIKQWWSVVNWTKVNELYQAAI